MIPGRIIIADNLDITLHLRYDNAWYFPLHAPVEYKFGARICHLKNASNRRQERISVF